MEEEAVLPLLLPVVILGLVPVPVPTVLLGGSGGPAEGPAGGNPGAVARLRASWRALLAVTLGGDVAGSAVSVLLTGGAGRGASMGVLERPLDLWKGLKPDSELPRSVEAAVPSCLEAPGWTSPVASGVWGGSLLKSPGFMVIGVRGLVAPVVEESGMLDGLIGGEMGLGTPPVLGLLPISRS